MIKNISCRECGLLFHTPKSRFGTKKFCSRQCAFIDQRKIEIKKKCKICGNIFIAKGLNRYTVKNCSTNCQKKSILLNRKDYYQKEKKIRVKFICRNCRKEYEGAIWNKVFCTNECQFNFLKKSRLGKDNPNYKSGIYTRNGFYKKGSKIQGKHLRVCSKFHKEFVEKYSYPFCEICGKSDQERYEVHHIYFASRFPRHPQLHNEKNLIHVCYRCHKKFHSGEYKKEFLELEKTRGLKELFL